MPDAAIRDAIEVAFAVAVAGQQLRPPLTPPPSLRPFLRFQKLPAAALGPVRKVVETDDEFRSKVMLAASEELVGRAGWLWVHRPEGWEDELASLVAEEAEAEQVVGAEKAERVAQRRLERAEQAARAATAKAAALQAELDGQRRERRDLDREHERAERRLQQLEIELRGARKRLAEAEARLVEATQPAAGHITDAATESAAVPPSEPPESPESPEPRPVADDAGPDVAAVDSAPDAVEPDRGVSSATEASPEVVVPVLASPPVTSPALAEALAAAAAASRDLSAALLEASRAAGIADANPGDQDASDDVTNGGPRAATPPARPRRGPRRAALPLPGGVWADSPEAALHLLRAPGVLLVVDGYNVAKLGWPQLALADQRSRLLDALDELVARYGTDVRVVFDGADVAQAPVRRRYLRVEFSPAGVTADDVIVGLAGSLPAERPIVVASNDGEVRAGVKAAGANVIGSEQLLAVARR